MTNYRQIADWGAQGGLLSERECRALYEIFHDAHRRVLEVGVLEVGHYLGLSTCVLADALEWTPLLTIDSHEGDTRVPAVPFEKFWANMELCGADHCIPLVMRSESIKAPLPFDAVFYDGDHEEEQMRFTQVVHESPNVRLFVFDDRDFPVPAKCCEFLRELGWLDHSEPIYRGPYDKATSETMTLGVFRR